MITTEIAPGILEHKLWEPLPNNSAEYQRVHAEVRSTFGRASQWTCIHCDVKAYHWAWQHDHDPNLISSYEPMCVSCHFRYDDNCHNGFKAGNTANRYG
jgi:hypothetical protein